MSKRRYVVLGGEFVDKELDMRVPLEDLQDLTRSQIASKIYPYTSGRPNILSSGHYNLLVRHGVRIAIAVRSKSKEELVTPDLIEHFERTKEAVENNPYRKKE